MADIIDLGPHDRIDMDTWRWPNFRPFELRHRFDDRVYVVNEFLDKIQELRNRVGFGLEVSSYYRSNEYDKSMGGAGVHPSGRAIDLLVAGPKAHTLLRAVFEMGFTGVGVNQRGPWDKRFIHLDDLETDKRPRVWTY